MAIIAYSKANPERPINDIPKSTRNQPRYWRFRLHWYIQVVTSFNVLHPEILLFEPNSIMPASIRTIYTPSIPEPPNARATIFASGILVCHNSNASLWSFPSSFAIFRMSGADMPSRHSAVIPYRAIPSTLPGLALAFSLSITSFTETKFNRLVLFHRSLFCARAFSLMYSAVTRALPS